MTTGVTAALVVAATGVTASPYVGEIDLLIDPDPDLLTIDAAGNALIARPAVTFTGGTASFVVPDSAEGLETEAWTALAAEDGRIIESEGT